MSILIKEIDLPKCCNDCEFMQCGYPDWCDLICRSRDIFNPSIRPEWCPLVEVKTPHGRLVEDTAVKEQIDDWLNKLGEAIIGQYYFELLRCIDDTPTVQPSTGWISIEDRLPKSGDHVLVNCRCSAGSYVCDAFYAAKKSVLCSRYDYECECDCEYDEEDDEFYLLEGWYEVIKNWGDYSSIVISDEITHWMPLPEPFEEEEK